MIRLYGRTVAYVVCVIWTKVRILYQYYMDEGYKKCSFMFRTEWLQYCPDGIRTDNAIVPSIVYTRKPSCRRHTRVTLAKSLHGLRNSSGVVSCIASLPIDSVPMVSYCVLYSKMHRFGDTRLLKLP